MTFRKQSLIGSVLVALLLATGGMLSEYRYWLASLAAIFAFAIIMLVLHKIHKRITSDVLRITDNVLPWEMHAMHVVLTRFPECTLPTTPWSMRFSNLHAILNLLDELKPQKIVEFGSGLSTLMIAAWLKEQNLGVLYSFDHDRDWAERTRQEARRHGLEKWIQLNICPLLPTNAGGHSTYWYDINLSPGELSAIDFIVIDGPPADRSSNGMSRLPALLQFAELTSSTASVVLDDAHRLGERKILEIWRNEFPEFKQQIIGQSSGLAILTKSSAG